MNNRGRGIVAYLVICFGLAWTLWTIPLLTAADGPLFQFTILPGAFAPAVAAFVVRRWVTGEGFADAGLNPRLRRGWRHYLFALLWPLVAAAAIIALGAALGLSRPDFSALRAMGGLAPGAEVPPFPTALWPVVPLQLLVVAVVATPVLWGEEFGWRGYLQTRLLADRPLPAAVATGLIWGVWHYPLMIFAGYNFPDDRLLGLLVFPVSAVLLSIVFGWLMQETGSVWAPSLAHSATNVVGSSLALLLFFGGPNWILLSSVGVLAWVPLGALCLWIVATGRLQPRAGTSTWGRTVPCLPRTQSGRRSQNEPSAQSEE
jgi:membrane protease YdiL (CAAX protease family)